MQTLFMILIGVIVGVLVGVVHFGGLAWTVRRFVAGSQPGVVALSFLVRMAGTALVVTMVALWVPLAALGVIPGVILARVILIHQAKTGVHTLGSDKGITGG